MRRLRRARKGWSLSILVAVIVGAGLALLTAIPSLAEDEPESWVEIAVADDGTRALVDERSLADHALGIALRQRFTRTESGDAPAGSIDQRVIYGCHEQAVYTVESVERDERGRPNGHRQPGTPERHDVRPGSLAHAVFDAVC